MEAALDTMLKVARAHINYGLRHGRQPLSASAALRGSIGEHSPERPASTSGWICGGGNRDAHAGNRRHGPQHPIVKLYCARAQSA